MKFDARNRITLKDVVGALERFGKKIGRAHV